MPSDPIVQEVRDAGQELADEANGDLKQFFANLRHAQEKYRDRLVSGTAREPSGDLPYVEGSNAAEIHPDQG